MSLTAGVALGLAFGAGMVLVPWFPTAGLLLSAGAAWASAHILFRRRD